jgi:hypothetical protein
MSFYSWRQHGLRYIIEIYPALAIISALGFVFIIKKLTKKTYGKILASSVLIVYLTANLWYVKPYYLDYFNELVGGTGTVWRYNLFQTGWWGQGIREAGLYLKATAPDGSKVAYAMSPEHTLPKFNNLKYYVWSPKEKYDYVIVNHYHIIRDGFDDGKIRSDYKLMREIKTDGATLVYIYEKR